MTGGYTIPFLILIELRVCACLYITYFFRCVGTDSISDRDRKLERKPLPGGDLPQITADLTPQPLRIVVP